MSRAQAAPWKLTDRDVPAPHVVGGHKILAHRVKDELGDDDIVAARRFARIDQRTVQTDRVNCADDGLGLIVKGDDRGFAVGAEGFDAALAAKQHDALVKDRKAAAELAAGEGFGCDTIEVRTIHGIIAAVEAHRLDIDVGVQKLCRLGADADGVVEIGLRGEGGVDAQLVDAVLVAAAVKNLVCIDGNGLSDARGISDRPGNNSVRHDTTSCDDKVHYSLCALRRYVSFCS